MKKWMSCFALALCLLVGLAVQAGAADRGGLFRKGDYL